MEAPRSTQRNIDNRFSGDARLSRATEALWSIAITVLPSVWLLLAGSGICRSFPQGFYERHGFDAEEVKMLLDMEVDPLGLATVFLALSVTGCRWDGPEGTHAAREAATLDVMRTLRNKHVQLLRVPELRQVGVAACDPLMLIIINNTDNDENSIM